MKERRLFDMTDAAGYLGMSKGFVEKEIREGRLQVLHLGRVRRIDVRELDRYIDAKAVVGNVGATSHHESTPLNAATAYIAEKMGGAR